MNISFVGDVSLTGSFKKDFTENDEMILSEEILEIFSKSDFTVCNLEGPVTEENCKLSPNLQVKSSLKSIPFLLKHHINVFGLANNHMFDAGDKGFKDTIEELNIHKSNYFGAGENIKEASKVCYLVKNDVKIGVIGVGHNKGKIAGAVSSGVFSYNQIREIKDRINEAKVAADWVVIVCHAGPEYNFIPTPITRTKMKSFLNLGADIIIGHHPHVIQGYEYVDNNKLIVYSLGNFIFDLKSTHNKLGHNEGLIASVKFSKQKFILTTNTTKINTSKGFVSLMKNNKLEKLSDFSNYDKKITKESIRCVFFNPIIPKEVSIKTFIYILFYPIVALFKMYLIAGYNREFVDIILTNYKLKIFTKFLRKDEFYKNN